MARRKHNTNFLNLFNGETLDGWKVVPVPFNKGDNMMLLQSCVSRNILGIYAGMEEVKVSLKSAKNKLNNPYSIWVRIYTISSFL